MEGEPAGGVATSSELADLGAKYGRILALREAHERAKAGLAREPDPRAEMAAIAARWPGALRELDELPLDVVRARGEALALAARDPSCAAPWMTAQVVFHRWARGALAAKRWLGKRRVVDAEVTAAFADACARGEIAEDASMWIDALATLARPPRGRVLDAVWPAVAEALGVSEAEARAVVFGPSRRSVTPRR